ncbi:TPA: cytidine deaminase [Pseudomonas aeruginosa]
MRKDNFSPAELIKKARDSAEASYSPYSQFPVGAVVVDSQGRIFNGTNIENASYGLTICAERVAIFSAISAGAKKIVAVAISSKNSKPICPCGACRQVFLEFCNAQTPIYSDNGDEGIITWRVAELLPNAFTGSELE